MNPHEQIDRLARSGGMCASSSSLRCYLKRRRAHAIRRTVKLALRSEEYDAADVDPKFKGWLS